MENEKIIEIASSIALAGLCQKNPDLSLSQMTETVDDTICYKNEYQDDFDEIYDEVRAELETLDNNIQSIVENIQNEQKRGVELILENIRECGGNLRKKKESDSVYIDTFINVDPERCEGEILELFVENSMLKIKVLVFRVEVVISQVNERDLDRIFEFYSTNR